MNDFKYEIIRNTCVKNQKIYKLEIVVIFYTLYVYIKKII